MGQVPNERRGNEKMSVGVGLTGAGVMGSEHARLLNRDIPGAHLAGVFDADAARARAAANGATVFSSRLSLIESDQVEAVIVASPDATHAELTLACLASGKPVLCEKPLASSAAEALRKVEAEVGLNRWLIQVGYMRRFDPAIGDMKRIRDEGGLGAIVLLHNVQRNASAPEWFTGPMALTNSFVHEIDVSRWLTGSEMVSAHIGVGSGADP
jgi:myo-inositol 2-dehydrogenase/D-chiro-inositol 1-dehydrogenase